MSFKPTLLASSLSLLFLLASCTAPRLSPEQALAREEETAAFVEAGITDSWEIARWRDLSLGPREARQWKKDGFRVEEVHAWDMLGMDHFEAKHWKDAGLKPADAARWKGHSPQEARELKRKQDENARRLQGLCPSLASQDDLIGAVPSQVFNQCYEIKAARAQLVLSPNSGIYRLGNSQMVFFDFRDVRAPPTAFSGLARGGGAYAFRQLSGETIVIPGLQVIDIADQY